MIRILRLLAPQCYLRETLICPTATICHIDPWTAIENIDTTVTEKRIVTGVTKHNVIPATALERVIS